MTSTLTPGMRLGPYEIESIIGQGGFGVTYKAFDVATSRVLAIKEYFPKADAVRDEDGGVSVSSREHEQQFRHGLDRFYQEARILARFDHPNIVKVYGTFPLLGTTYIAMEYIPDLDLEKWARQSACAPTQSEIEPFAAALLDALDIIHRNELLHRDLSPRNILLRPNGLPVIIDFGSARHAIGNVNLTTIVTPNYAPPEQYSSQGQGPWTDIYGAAATMYRLIIGNAPVEAPARITDEALHVPAASAARGRYSPTFLEAIDWGLRVDPQDRPQTVQDWRRALLMNERPSARKIGLKTGIKAPPDNRPLLRKLGELFDRRQDIE